MARFSYHDESITEEIQQEFCSLTVTQNAIAGRWITLGAGLGGVVIVYTAVLNLGWIAGLTVLLALLTASISFGLDKRRKGNFVNS